MSLFSNDSSWKASVNSVCRRPSVGSKRAQKGSVRSVSSVREKNIHEWISVLKTSVTSVFSVRENTPNVWGCDAKDRRTNLFVVTSVILNTHEKHLQRVTRKPFIYDRNISKMEEYNAHDFRELWTRNEERPFLHHEGPFQASRRACSLTLKGVFHNLEWPPLYLRTMKIAYKHTLLNPLKQPCLIHNPTLNCPHILLVSPPTHSSSPTKS